MALPEPTPRRASSLSGKLVIIGILLVVIWAVPVSLWFWYIATHRAVRFWGADSVALVRDASQVTLKIMPYDPADPQTSSTSIDIDVSKARGLTYLRNALLDDRNFTWPRSNRKQLNANDFHDWKWLLDFRDPQTGKSAAMQFTKDCNQAAPLISIRVSEEKMGSQKIPAVLIDPLMAKKLREMFAEFSAASSVNNGTKSQAAGSAAKPAR